MVTDIIILTKTPTLLDSCLGSLAKHADLKSIGSIVVGITDKKMTLDCCDAINYWCSAVHSEVVEIGSYNYSANNNMLARDFCKSECVTFMNDDVVLVEDPFKRCLDVLENDSMVGTVGIELIYPNGLVQHAGIFYRYKPTGEFEGVGHLGINQAMSLPDMWTAGNTGAFLMARKADFDAVGGFDEGYKSSFQDVQLNMEIAIKLGKKNVTLNSIRAFHKEKGTRGQNSDCVEDLVKMHNYFNENREAIAASATSEPRLHSEYGRE